MRERKPIGRPPCDIDASAVERAASIGCTGEEIAALLGIARSTFYLRMQEDIEVKEAFERGREKGRATLRRLQWHKANAGSDTMLIWLGKQMLGQKDKTALTGDDSGSPIKTALEITFVKPVVGGNGAQ
jgi:hypothetical protein